MDQFRNHPLYKQHNIDSAISSLWDFYKKNFLQLYLISLVMSFIIQYISSFINIKELTAITDPLMMLEKVKDYIVPILLISLLSLLFTTIIQYYIIYNPLDRKINIFISTVKSMKFFIPYLIIMILLAFTGSIIIALGLLVIVIGAIFSGIYIMTIFFFILPVLMVEGININNAIRRTVLLSHRNFWSNISWVAVFFILLIIITVLLSGIILVPFTGSFVKTVLNPQDAGNIGNYATNPLFIVLSSVTNALTIPLMPIFGCILYFNRKAREEENQIISPVNSDNERVKVEDLYAKPYSDDHPENPDKKS
jgi:hypothetical protein